MKGTFGIVSTLVSFSMKDLITSSWHTSSTVNNTQSDSMGLLNAVDSPTLQGAPAALSFNAEQRS
ncbi:hypothetical protein EON65_03535 [archaeon]|nr:MAG: hypothetical protein EON65_03535 [archaeon]